MAIIPANYTALEGSELGPVAGARITGPANPNEVLTVSVYIRRLPDGLPLPDPIALAARPTAERHYLSREELAARYGASKGDLDKVADFARANGLTVVESSIPRRVIVLKGTVLQMSKAFAVDLNVYETPKEKYRGRGGKIHVPIDLATIVEGVFGLDNRRMASPLQEDRNAGK
jgi:kumamolisin